ncbi:MAG: hypothetical protein CSA81_08115 [Acidobacteria bacterium]|nr:MAG: hypothetical protein CSA81_08115 [Acidobacteriota bacterium]PIE89691.1 MAG: hypothetical protein CR997_09650 [Acidobacteriota bacterium]
MIRIEIKTTLEQEDLLEEWLWQYGALSVDRKPHSSVNPDSVVSLGALLSCTDTAQHPEQVTERVIRDLTAFFQEKDIISVSGEEVAPQDWQNQWRENFNAFSIGAFRVIPEWHTDSIVHDDKTLIVYPGQAFGTGQHETTKLMLKALLNVDCRGKSVLDVGCGTGILSIAAEKCGADRVFGFDVDRDCKENMRRHLKMNQTKKTTLEIGHFEDFSLQKFDVVLMNITLNVLRELWPKVPEHLSSRGMVISSGMLVEQLMEARQLLEALGLVIVQEETKGEWALLIAKRA